MSYKSQSESALSCILIPQCDSHLKIVKTGIKLIQRLKQTKGHSKFELTSGLCRADPKSWRRSHGKWAVNLWIINDERSPFDGPTNDSTFVQQFVFLLETSGPLYLFAPTPLTFHSIIHTNGNY